MDFLIFILDSVYLFFSFQLPAFLSQVKEALGLPLPPSSQASPVAGPSGAPPVPVPVQVSSSAPPPIVLENSDSENDVQTLAVPFRSASSEAYLLMISTDDSWATDTEFRFVFSYMFCLASGPGSVYLFLHIIN